MTAAGSISALTCLRSPHVGLTRPAVRLGQPFMIENRSGGGNIGTEAVVRTPADGYTLLMVGSDTGAINATLYDKLNFNFIRDIAPVAGLTRVPNVIVVDPSVPARTVPEPIRLAKSSMSCST